MRVPDITSKPTSRPVHVQWRVRRQSPAHAATGTSHWGRWQSSGLRTRWVPPNSFSVPVRRAVSCACQGLMDIVRRHERPPHAAVSPHEVPACMLWDLTRGPRWDLACCCAVSMMLAAASGMCTLALAQSTGMDALEARMRHEAAVKDDLAHGAQLKADGCGPVVAGCRGQVRQQLRLLLPQARVQRYDVSCLVVSHCHLGQEVRKVVCGLHMLCVGSCTPLHLQSCAPGVCTQSRGEILAVDPS